MARNSVCKKTKIEGGVIFDFANGEQVTTMFNDFPVNMQVEFGLHGISQKLGDSYADADDINSAVALFKDCLTSIMDSNWNKRTTGVLIVDLANVVASITGKTPAEALDKIKELSDDDVKALKKRKDVASGMARLKADRLASGVGSEEAIDIFA